MNSQWKVNDMPQVALKVFSYLYPHTYIFAPDFCPYKIYPGIDHPVVDASLCPLCKICTFVPETVDLADPMENEREEFGKHLLSDTSISSSISGQREFLIRQGRIPLALLISPTVFDDLLKKVVNDKSRREKLHSYFLLNESPLCTVSGVPVYFSRKLTKSNVQLVGEIEWK